MGQRVQGEASGPAFELPGLLSALRCGALVVMTIPRPPRSDRFFQNYLDLAPEGDVLDLLEHQGAALASQVSAWSDGELSTRYAPGKWTAKEVLGHLADGERIFAYRLLWLARGGGDNLPSFEEDDFVATAQFDRLSPAELANELATVRRSTLSLLRTLPQLDWQATASVGGNPMTLSTIPWLMVGHERHHLQVLAQRYGLALPPDLP